MQFPSKSLLPCQKCLRESEASLTGVLFHLTHIAIIISLPLASPFTRNAKKTGWLNANLSLEYQPGWGKGKQVAKLISPRTDNFPSASNQSRKLLAAFAPRLLLSALLSTLLPPSVCNWIFIFSFHLVNILFLFLFFSSQQKFRTWTNSDKTIFFCPLLPSLLSAPLTPQLLTHNELSFLSSFSWRAQSLPLLKQNACWLVSC
jgi:hypothetical protein